MMSIDQQPSDSMETQPQDEQEENLSYELDTSLSIDEELIQVLYEMEEENRKILKEKLAIEQGPLLPPPSPASASESEDEDVSDDEPYDVEDFEAMPLYRLKNISPSA